MEVTKDELSKLRLVATKLAKEIQEIQRAWGPTPDKDKDKDKKGKSQWRKKGDWGERGCRGVGHPNHRRPLPEPLQPRAPARAVGGCLRINAARFMSGIVDSFGHIPSGMPGTRPERKVSCNGCWLDNRPSWTDVSDQGSW